MRPWFIPLETSLCALSWQVWFCLNVKQAFNGCYGNELNIVAVETRFKSLQWNKIYYCRNGKKFPTVAMETSMILFEWREVKQETYFTYKSMAPPSLSHLILGFNKSEPRPYAPQNKVTFDPTIAVWDWGFNVNPGSTPWNSFLISKMKYQ